VRVELSDVGHAFERGRFLFRHVTMQLPPGGMIALVGPSGSGKSTLLSIVAGWQVPTEGQVVRDDIARVAWVFQNPFGVPARTVLDHVSLPDVARGSSRSEADRRARGLLERFGLADQGRRPFATLSGGEAQRLMLARAVASEPDLILVDEPTAQLDATSAATVIDVLDGLADHGASVIIATHDTRVQDACPVVLDLGSRAPDLVARLVDTPVS
jgi:ABC-type lipoprotein export system ATPase subunit